MHCFVEIVQSRFPGHEISTVALMRDAIATYFENHNNHLEVVDPDDTRIFSCESIDCIRTGKDSTNCYRYYGGISECVAFSYLFNISLQVYAPESMDAAFVCRGGGITDHCHEVIIYNFGWHGICRTPGQDHWQRLISVSASVPLPSSIAPNENCVVSTSDGHCEAKVARALQCKVAGTGTFVYCYALTTHYGGEIGHFSPAQVRRPQVYLIEDCDDVGTMPGYIEGGDDDGSGSGNDSQGAGSGNGSGDDDGARCGNDDADSTGDAQDDDDDAASAHAVSSVANASTAKRAPGRKRKSDEEDPTVWCQETLLTFLSIVVARNPFEKESGKIGDKWHDIALDMAQATRSLGVHAVTARSEALRMKFTRLKLQLKNWRRSGKSSRQSGIASVQLKNKNMSALAEKMDECLNLQQCVQDVKQSAKEQKNAAVSCKSATAARLHVNHSYVEQCDTAKSNPSF